MFDDFDDFYDAAHAPEFIYFTPYCTGCDTTFLYLEESLPGFRTSMTLKCPTCDKELGTVEKDTTLLAQAKGQIGGEIHNHIPPEVKEAAERRMRQYEPEQD